MTRRASPMLRWSRASLLGLVVLATGAVAHTSAGGLLPSTTALVSLAALCTVGSAAFLGGPASARRLSLLLVGGQAFVHTALAATAGHLGEVRGTHLGSAVPSPTVEIVPWDPRSGQSYGAWEQQYFGSSAGAELALPTWMTHAVTDLVTHPATALAHVLAAIAVGLWLAVGERALWNLLALAADGALAAAARLTEQLAGPSTVVPNFSPALASPAPLTTPRLRGPVTSRGAVRRGPPAWVLAA